MLVLDTFKRKTLSWLYRRLQSKCYLTQGIIPYCSSSHSTPAGMTLLGHLKQRIKATGPITVASYMKEALTNPIWGYYMKNDVFGSKGDFTTSPEISQMFGELVGIWFVLQWIEMGRPSDFRLVELGPGRGTLMADILRVFRRFSKDNSNSISVCFVEVSEKMKELQKNALQRFKTTISVEWYQTVQDVPEGLNFYMAHEFFDALPVHLFQKVNNEWRELLVNFSHCKDRLELVVAPGPSPLAMSMLKPPNLDDEKCELCPEAAVIMTDISQNIAKHGGFGLIVDYGEVYSDRHSLRGFKDHALVSDVLKSPGECDLTANVDFSFLKKYIHNEVSCYGPISQHKFLLQMGIQERLKILMRGATSNQQKNLLSSFEYLVSPQRMGEKFKVLALNGSKDKIPVPFT